jgi:hypothetical protein
MCLDVEWTNQKHFCKYCYDVLTEEIYRESNLYYVNHNTWWADNGKYRGKKIGEEKTSDLRY